MAHINHFMVDMDQKVADSNSVVEAYNCIHLIIRLIETVIQLKFLESLWHFFRRLVLSDYGNGKKTHFFSILFDSDVRGFQFGVEF